MKRLDAFGKVWNNCFHAPCPLYVSAAFRIGYAALLLINVGFWLPDLHRWFGANGLFPKGTSEAYYGHSLFSLLDWLPESNTFAYICYAIFVIQILGLLVGWRTRFQAIGVYLWFLSFMNHSPMLWAGEDTVFAIFGFLLVFLPSAKVLSFDTRHRTARAILFHEARPAIWPLRLIQFQTCLIVFASGLQKLSGESWQNGTALYYISRLDDTFGRFPVPPIFIEWLPAIRVLTWSVIVIEILVPICVWHPKLRTASLCAAFLLHLGIEYAMDLFLFEWIMMLGWCTFLREPRALRGGISDSGMDQGSLRNDATLGY